MTQYKANNRARVGDRNVEAGEIVEPKDKAEKALFDGSTTMIPLDEPAKPASDKKKGGKKPTEPASDKKKGGKNA